MNNITIDDREVLFSRSGELISITAVGKNAIRFRAFPGCRVIEENYTLMPQSLNIKVSQSDDFITAMNGTLSVKLSSSGKVEYYSGAKLILEEKPELTFKSGFRRHLYKSQGCWQSRVTFKQNEGERFFGLGHRFDNPYNLKGCSFDIANTNASCTMPYVYSSAGYGFLWNNPGTGSVELSNNLTRFSADSCRFVDYVVIAGNPKEAASALADLTGYAPKMPHWATGFWQSRLRYESDEELLNVARRYHKEGIPLSVIVADYFHWTEQGDYKFDPEYWKDIKKMTDELHSMGTKLVVSIWPTINENSENYEHMRNNNLLIRTSRGSDRVFPFYGWQAEIDMTNKDTRDYVWSKIKQNYLDNGVDAVWLDEAEPEIHPEHFDNLLFSKGSGDTVALLYPYCYAQMAYEGFESMGRNDICTLVRCAYLGSQKFGALVWSGDIESSFESLRCQVHAGLNMSMCGIPWWNTDIGGFYGGDITTDYFRELIIRWFQFGVFCPVTRLHGARKLHGEKHNVKEPTGDPNELWSFGDDNFAALKKLVALRERLRPYIEQHMDVASKKGYPVMRPMFFDFPDDEECYDLPEQYMFGSQMIFAPVVEQGQKSKSVYLPQGKWVLTKTGEVYGPGRYDVPLESIYDYIAFVEEGADVLAAFKE